MTLRRRQRHTPSTLDLTGLALGVQPQRDPMQRVFGSPAIAVVCLILLITGFAMLCRSLLAAHI